jgi:hypothetical protein
MIDMALSSVQRQRFFDQGMFRLPRAFSELEAQRMVEDIWQLLEERSGVRRGDPSTWTERQPTGFQSLTHKSAFHAIASPIVTEALDDLLGVGAWVSPKAWGAPLITFPEQRRAWDIPVNQWHLDFPARGNPNEFPGIRVLAFIARVETKGGGTVVAAGSHRLVEELIASRLAQGGHSANVRDALAASHAWFRALWSEAAEPNRVHRFLAAGEYIGGVHVCVEELTGMPGDVTLMHPWTFHAPAPNCSRSPRMMVSHSVYRKSALPPLFALD